MLFLQNKAIWDMNRAQLASKTLTSLTEQNIETVILEPSTIPALP